MQKSLGEVFGHAKVERNFCESADLVLPRCCVGVEVELENMHGYSVVSNLWTTKNEGSLRRGGLEYIFSEPLFGADVITALDVLEKELTPLSPSIDENCSVHVHIDVRDMAAEDINKLILLYVIYEQSLYRYASPERENNVFCLSFNRSQQLLAPLGSIIDSITHGRTGTLVDTIRRMPRYCGLNLNAIQLFGSVEFRSHRATYKKDEILKWINILMCLKRAATDPSFNIRPYLTIKSLGIEHATTVIFGEHASSILSSELEDEINTGMALARRITNKKLLNEVITKMDIPKVKEPAEASSTEELIEDMYRYRPSPVPPMEPTNAHGMPSAAMSAAQVEDIRRIRANGPLFRVTQAPRVTTDSEDS